MLSEQRKELEKMIWKKKKNPEKGNIITLQFFFTITYLSICLSNYLKIIPEDEFVQTKSFAWRNQCSILFLSFLVCL